MLNNKKGLTPGASWIYGLFSLFGLGILYIVFSQVFHGYLIPVITSLVDSSAIAPATKVTIVANINKYMIYFDFLPFILFFAVVVFMIVQAFRKEQTDAY